MADWTFNYTLPIGELVHLAMTNSGTQTKLYVNGAYHSAINASISLPRKWISKGAEDASLKAKIDELLRLVELDDAANRRTNTYSGDTTIGTGTVNANGGSAIGTTLSR